MKSLIFGYGVTGQSFERYLNKKNIVFEIYDANLIGPNISNMLPDKKKLESYEMIYMSPGINLPFFFAFTETSFTLPSANSSICSAPGCLINSIR
mgnify:CR=1 FL=1